MFLCFFFFFKQKTAYEMRISDWSSDVCSSDLGVARHSQGRTPVHPVKAYKNNEFLMSEAARGLRILCEYAEPERRFRQTGVRNTVAFFGSHVCVPVSAPMAETGDRKSTRLNSSH